MRNILRFLHSRIRETGCQLSDDKRRRCRDRCGYRHSGDGRRQAGCQVHRRVPEQQVSLHKKISPPSGRDIFYAQMQQMSLSADEKRMPDRASFFMYRVVAQPCIFFASAVTSAASILPSLLISAQEVSFSSSIFATWRKSAVRSALFTLISPFTSPERTVDGLR